MEAIVTDRLASYGAALKILATIDKRESGRLLNNRAENSYQSFPRQERAMLRFRRMQILQKLTALHGSIHNQFASRPFGSTRNETSPADRHSKIAAPSLLPSGVNFLLPDDRWGRGISETFLVSLTAQIVERRINGASETTEKSWIFVAKSWTFA